MNAHKSLMMAGAVLALSGCMPITSIMDWPNRDKLVFGVSTACHIADTLETVHLLKNKNYHETAPGLGSHPSERTLYASGLLYIGATYYLGSVMPQPEARDGDRTMVLAAATLPCAYAVSTNGSHH